MALFGRENERDAQRAEAFTRWARSRTPYALFAGMLGLLGMIDSFTIVLGGPAAVAAIVLGIMGLRDLRRKPELLGRRLCIAGIVMGSIGLVLTAAWTFALHRPR